MAQNSKATVIRKRGPGRPFQPGQSGNPGGRPRIVAHLRDLARRHTDKALETITGLMQDQKSPPAIRLKAAEILLDRGYGRPAQGVIEESTPESAPPEYSDLEIARRILFLVDKAAREMKERGNVPG